jgi:hypothetical protein
VELKGLVDRIDKLYKAAPLTAKEIVRQEIYDEIRLQIQEAKLQVIKDLFDGFRLVVRHYKDEIHNVRSQNGHTS